MHPPENVQFVSLACDGLIDHISREGYDARTR